MQLQTLPEVSCFLSQTEVRPELYDRIGTSLWDVLRSEQFHGLPICLRQAPQLMVTGDGKESDCTSTATQKKSTV